MTNSDDDNVSNIIIDIHRETGQNIKQRKKKHHNGRASADTVRTQNQFINITAESILGNDKRKKKKSSRRIVSRDNEDARPNVTTRSMKRKN